MNFEALTCARYCPKEERYIPKFIPMTRFITYLALSNNLFLFCNSALRESSSPFSGSDDFNRLTSSGDWKKQYIEIMI